MDIASCAPIPCKLCPAVFATRQALYDHVATHAEDEDADTEDEESSEQGDDDEAESESSSSVVDDDEEDRRIGFPLNGSRARKRRSVVSESEVESDVDSERNGSRRDSSSDDDDDERDEEEPSPARSEDEREHEHVSNGVRDERRVSPARPQTNGVPFPCLMCPRVYKNKYSRNAHMKRDHQVIPLDDKYYCSACDMIFTRKREFARHEKTHVRNEAAKPRRKTSTKRLALLRQRYALKQQQRREDELRELVHGEEKTFEEQLSSSSDEEEKAEFMCSVCGFLANSASQLRWHFYKHSADMDFPEWMASYVKSGAALRMDDADSDFSVSSEETNGKPPHVNGFGSAVASPDSERNEVCIVSVQQIPSFGGSERIQETPNGLPGADTSVMDLDVQPSFLPPAPGVNGEKFVKTPVRSYPCPECDQVFSRSSARSTHMNKRHLHAMNFQCPNCPKGFLREGNLRHHLRSCVV